MSATGVIVVGVDGMAAGVVIPPFREQLAEEAERTARRTVTEVVDSVDGAVPVEIRVVQGNPAKVLLDQAAEADLLVVGHRGLGAFASACLGSVGLQCVLHAPCPVVVVPPGATTTGSDATRTVGTEVRT